MTFTDVIENDLACSDVIRCEHDDCCIVLYYGSSNCRCGLLYECTCLRLILFFYERLFALFICFLVRLIIIILILYRSEHAAEEILNVKTAHLCFLLKFCPTKDICKT